MAQRYAAALAANALTDITAGGAEEGTYLLNVVNRSPGDTVTVRIAVTSGGAPGDADWLEYGTRIEPNGVLSRWPFPVGAGWKVYVWASLAVVSVNLIGVKES